MTYRKGVILLYVLALFVFFIAWFDLAIRWFLQDIYRKHALGVIQKRLDIEAQIVGFYRDERGETYDFDVEGSHIVSYKVGERVYVNVDGDLRMHFKYDIIEDGSFLHSQWED